jgi:Carboxypeptidase regulatory-like domain/TonB-dependent Receptor Plug Domain
MQRQRFLVAVFAVLFLCFPMLLKGQELQGTLNGTVSDPSGAVIPGATVTITQNGVNGASRTVQTNAQGSYTATNLPAGNYTVTVTAAGFQTSTAPNVTLFVAQTRAVNATLKPGAVSQTVTVNQSAVALDTTTSAVAGTISGTQVRELQLNNRNFEQLVTLQPGVVSALPDEVGFGLSNTDQLFVNGARGSANNWTVDGADINDSGSNLTLLNVPSVDSIQEFTLERSTYDAGYGRSGGAQVLVATRSGSSSFHGAAYEFNRNDAFNANSYFNKNVTPIIPRAIERYNDYGFAIGGPLYIPKVFNTDKNRFFFFWSEEWRKVSSPVTSSATPPSASELAGMFPGDISNQAPAGCVAYDVTTNTSTINPTCYSKNAKVYLTNLYDIFRANNPTTGQYVFSYSQLNNTREDLVRFDWNISQKLHFFGRAMRDETPENFPEGLFSGGQFPTVASTAVNAPGENVVGNLTWTISPRMVNELEFAYTQGEISANFEPGAIANDPAISKALTNNTKYTDPYGRIPNVTISGITGFTTGNAPYTERNLDRTLFDNFSVTLGRHTLRVGATVSQMLKTENATSGDAGFTFLSFQNFLLGQAFRYTQASKDTIPDLHYLNFEAYAQDDWQVSPKLTVNLGIRYSYFPSPSDVNNTLNNFDPLVFDPAKAPTIDSSDASAFDSSGNALYPSAGNFAPGGQIPATYVNGIIFPTGRACSTAQAIAPGVTCSPYGAHVNPDPKKNFAPRVGFAYSVNGKMAIHGGFGLFYDRLLNGIWEDNAFSDPPLVQTATITNTSFDNPLGGGTASIPLGPNALQSTGDPTMKTPYLMDYNLSVQDQILPNTVAEIAYVGNQGRQLLGERDLNQPTLAERQTKPLAYVTAVVPYRGYSTFTTYLPGYNSNYNSLQVSLNHRTQHGLTLGIAYTWGRALTTQANDRATATYNTYDVQADYGPAQFNQPNTFVANYVYELPFYKGQHGVVGHILGGWEVSGITQFDSGQSVIIRQNLDPFDCVSAVTFPDGSRDGCIPGTYPGGVNIDASAIAPRPDQVAPVHMIKTQKEWFSTSSFKDAVGHFGTAPNGPLLGPGINLWDLAAIKNIDLGGNGTRSLQFRGEFFNAFNHTNFGASGITGGGIGNNVDSSSYGQVTAAHDPRQIQLGGKFYF